MVQKLFLRAEEMYMKAYTLEVGNPCVIYYEIYWISPSIVKLKKTHKERQENQNQRCLLRALSSNK